MQITGWPSTAMAARYRHVPGGILADVAKTADEGGSKAGQEAR